MSNLIFHLQIFYLCPTKNRNDKTRHHIGDGRLHAKDTD